MDVALVISLGALVTAPALTLATSKRTASGRVATTEAARLWDEAKDLRMSYKADQDRAETDLHQARAELATMRLDLVSVRAENTALRTEVGELRAEVERLYGLIPAGERRRRASG